MSDEQSLPVHASDATAVFPLVRAEVEDNLRGVYAAKAREALLAIVETRRAKGLATYGAELHTPNGRSMVRDALEEAADLLVYAVGMRAEFQRQRAAQAVTMTQADADDATHAVMLCNMARAILSDFAADVERVIHWGSKL